MRPRGAPRVSSGSWKPGGSRGDDGGGIRSEADFRAKVWDRASVSKRVGTPRTRWVDAIRPIGALAQSGVYPIVPAYRARTFPAPHSIVTFFEAFA
jgi:hypothetical protein